MAVAARLFTAPDWAAAHEHVYLPWLREIADRSWKTARPPLVIVPARSDAYFCKAAALAEERDLLGVQFVTPIELRERLRRTIAATRALPLREHLRLLLAAAAEKLGSDRTGDPALSAAAASPDHVLRAIDLLEAGGWDFREHGPQPLRALVAEFARLLRGCGFDSVHRLDREFLDAAPLRPPLFGSVIVFGFDAAHWPLWPLLAASVHSSEEARIGLRNPRTEAEEIDQSWIGTWEEEFGAAEPVEPRSAARPFELLVESECFGGAIEFLAGQTTLEQARAIVQKAVEYLADPACKRLGIFLPGRGALARQVADQLATLEIPHNDGIAHIAPGDFECPEWLAWLELQESFRLPALLRFLRDFPRAAELFFELPRADVADGLRRAFHELLLDDLALLADWLTEHSLVKHAPRLAAGLRAMPLLPERAPLVEFLEKTERAFEHVRWTAHAEELRRLSRGWSSKLTAPISRAAFLRWMREVLVSFCARRASGGNHPYSRTQLLPYSAAETQSFTHIVGGGLNEGAWPPARGEGGWIGEQQIAELNRSVRGFNRRAAQRGGQGEGHWTIRRGHTLCLGPSQRRDIAARQFLNAIESASVRIAATLSLSAEADPARVLNPSEFFSRLYFCAHGRAVSRATLSALRDSTAQWLTSSGLWKATDDSDGIQQTRIAFQARRTPEAPFGEYEFAFREPPSKPLRLTATAWESALKSPALVWLERVLGVSASDEKDDESPWNLALGSWVHRWLSAIAHPPGAPATLPACDDLCDRVRGAANLFRERVVSLLRRHERLPPDWWLSFWQQAAQIAQTLGCRVSEITGCTHFVTEWKLPDTAIALGENRRLHVRGRIDAMIGQAVAAGATFPSEPWILDYKTGEKKPLTIDRLWKAEGLQLALYALAVREHDAKMRGISLLWPGAKLDAPQLTFAALASIPPLWEGLHRMQESGVFGWKGKVRDEFSFASAYPLATLEVDADLLEEKWARTHPLLAGKAEEDSA